MKAWTLIAFYLSKDIWSRWLEHPGAVFARLFVGVLLAALLLFAQAGFMIAGRSLEMKVARLGAGTLLLTEVAGPERIGQPSLGRLLAPLGDRAQLIAFRQLPVSARDPLHGECLVLAYGRETFAALAPSLATVPPSAIYYVTAKLPSGVTLEVEIDGVLRSVVTVQPPTWLARLPLFNPLLIVPDELATAWEGQGHFEFCLLLADPSRPAEVRALAEGVRTILAMERRDTAQLQSPETLLDEIAALSLTRERTQALAGIAGGIVLALVFGAIASLEYRQNRYIVALLRSFGAPATLVLLRYAVEAVVLLALAGFGAGLLAANLHSYVFGFAGFEAGLLDRIVLDPYAPAEVWTQLRWLLVGALFSVVPISFALRQPVGRILQ
ncbi:MAG: hypothetical protein ABW223_05120 [Rariglobus sp.]